MFHPIVRAGSRRLKLAAFISLGILAAASPAAASDELTSTVESDCAEVRINRAANLNKARAIVPKRYELLTSATGAARLVFVDYRCSSLAVDGHPPAREATVSKVGYEITSRDGSPTGYLYLVAIATDHPVLFARYQAAGLPAEFDPRTGSSSFVNTDGRSALAWTIVGDGLDHTLSVVPNEPPATPLRRTIGNFWFDGLEGDLHLTFANELRPAATATIVSGDFTQAATWLTSLFAAPNFLTLTPGTSFGFDRGNWTGRLERVPPPELDEGPGD